jgi:hypothetical protein
VAMMSPAKPKGGAASRVTSHPPPLPLPTVCEDITEQTDEYSVDGPAEVLRHGEPF